MQPPVRYSPDVEAVRPDEGQIIEQLNAAFDKILTRVAEDSGTRCARSTPNRTASSKVR